MPHYRAPDGTRYLTDEPPHADWVLMTAEEVAEADAPRPVVPASVEMVQARLALLAAGITEAMVEAAIAKLPLPQSDAAMIEWRFRPHVRRDSALVQALGPALGLTGEQIDQLFIAGADL